MLAAHLRHVPVRLRLPQDPDDLLRALPLLHALSLPRSSHFTRRGREGKGQTWYSIDGETAVEFTAPFQPKDAGLAFGAHEIAFWSGDRLGNVEAAETFVFTVSPALAVTRRIDHTPRVLLWWNENAGEGDEDDDDDRRDVTSEARRRAFENIIATRSLLIDTATTDDSFIALMRTARHNVYVIVGDRDGLSGDLDEELAARIDAGAGLIASVLDRIDGPKLAHDRGEDDEDENARDNSLGVKVAGLLGDSPTVSVFGETFTAPGRAERVRATFDVTVPGVFVDVPRPETPAVTLRRYGSGKAAFIDFHVVGTPNSFISTLLDAVQPETEIVVPGGVTALAIDVASLVVPLDLTVCVEEILPPGVTVLDVRPAPTSQQPHLLTWYVVLDAGEETTVGYTATFPAGTSEPEAIVAYLVRGTYREFGRFAIEVDAPVRGDLAGAAADSMIAFAATLPTLGGDRERVEKAVRDVEALENAVFADIEAVEKALKDALDAIEAVTRTGRAGEGEGRAIRDLLDRLVAALGREWAALP